MSISPRDRLIVTIAAALLIVVALVATLVYPQFQRLGELSSQVVEASGKAQAAKLQLDLRRGFKDRAVETNAKWLRLMNQVPDNPDLPALIIELQDTAFKSGVQLISVTPATPSLGGAYSTVPVQMEILGTWSDTINYMQALMKLDRGTRLVNVTCKVSSNDERGGGGLPPFSVDTVVNLMTYMIPTASTAASTTAPAGATQ